ncbi:lipoyl synthase [Sedimenticola hydrogenitrophicus]|uniref:lipoyl synthase n=1 Tax=Sedimenticola hydrogenitrophicus TaxID=2967975 RepID=UPI0023AEF2DB|nr:lipoyl synthase [Sedimenticola hydrogenitrophicus]
MSKVEDHNAPSRATPETHQRGSEKLARIPIKVEPTRVMPRKPDWIRVKLPSGERVNEIKQILRQSKLSSVCEEAACPNLGECFSHGTATFMIMGDICTRRCPFCDVAHGKPLPLDANEPAELAEAVKAMRLRYVVVTSVDRDDLRDGGAGHFVDCITALREHNPETRIEILVPDFRGRVEVALEAFAETRPDVFNHNLETVPRLYRQARPGADYRGSLELLDRFKRRHPEVQTKSGLMLGLGETHEEVLAVMRDLRDHQVNMLTLGQYLQPSREHLAVDRFVTPREFDQLRQEGESMGFSNVASGPLVRSSYHADLQANPLLDRDERG